MSAGEGSRRILAVSAHPDDDVLGMGGALALHAHVLGDSVRVLCLTEGSSAQYPGDEERRAQKAAEARRAAAVLGVEEFVHLDLPDMRLDTLPQLELNGAIEEQVRTFEPDVVYTVHPDVNSDHRAVFRSVAVATRMTPAQRVRCVLTFAPPSSIEWTPTEIAQFVPTWFVDIGRTLEHKLEAFACFETETRSHPHPRSARGLLAHANFYGAAAGCEFAEPFVLVRNVVRSERARDGT